MKVEIIRTEHTTKHTIGIMRVDGAQFCSTLELSWLNNIPFISCIPCGAYTCRRIHSAKYGDTFEITGVPDRDNILLHAGNWASNTEGCVLLGQHAGKLRNKRAVLNSGKTFRKFLALTQHVDNFDLFILSV
jgi:hypothetical protein